MTLAAPGGAGELRALAGRLLSRPLDMDRPLWRLSLIDGLAGGGWAIVGQAHHALVDGIAAVQVALLLFDGVDAGPSDLDARSRRAGAARVAQAGAARAARAPSPARCAGRACRCARSAPPRRRSRGPRRPTALDRSLTHRREVAFAEAPLDELREAGRRCGATVNDVLLAASSLALGRALARRGERPQAVKALVPVNTRTGEPGDLGNDISFVTVELPVRETDPLTSCAPSATPRAQPRPAARRGRCARSPRPRTCSPRRAGGSSRAPPRAPRPSTSSCPTCPARRST